MSTDPHWRRALAAVASQLPANLTLVPSPAGGGLEVPLDLVLPGNPHPQTVGSIRVKASRKLPVRRGRVQLDGLPVKIAKAALSAPMPVVLAVAESKGRRAYWYVVGQDDALSAALQRAEAMTRATLSLPIPARQRLGRADALQEAIAERLKGLALRQAQGYTPAKAPTGPPAPDAVAAARHGEDAHFERLHAEGRFEEALERGRELLVDRNQPPAARVAGGLEMLTAVRAMGPWAADRSLPVGEEATAAMLMACRPRRVPRNLQRLAITLRRTHQLSSVVSSLSSAANLIDIRRRQDDATPWPGTSRLAVGLLLHIVSVGLGRLRLHTTTLLREAPRTAALAWPVVGHALAEAQDAFRRLDAPKLEAYIEVWLASLPRDVQMELEECRRARSDLAERTRPADGSPPFFEVMRPLVRATADGLGIDLVSPRSELERFIHTRLHDLRDTRFRSHCRHLQVTRVDDDALGDLLGLPSAYQLRCQLPGELVLRGPRLPVAFDTFLADNCRACRDRVPPHRSGRASADRTGRPKPSAVPAQPPNDGSDK